MNSIRIVEIRNFLNKDDTNFKELIKDFQGILKLEKALSDGLLKFENQLVIIGKNEINQIMSKIFHSFASTYKLINESRRDYLDLLEHKVIPSINAQIAEVKDRRSTLADYEKKKQTEEKKELTCRMNTDHTKTNQMNMALEEAKKDSGYAASSLNNKMRMYISEKNSEIQSMFQHIINCELHYNATGLEKLSELAQFINRSGEEVTKDSQKLLDTLLGTSNKSDKQDKQLTIAVADGK